MISTQTIRSVAGYALGGALLANCGGGSSSTAVSPQVPAASTPAPVTVSAPTTVPLAAGPATYAFPPLSGFSGGAAMPAPSSAVTGTMSLASAVTPPCGSLLPLSALRRTQSQTVTVVFCATFTPSVDITFASLPQITLTLPSNVPTAGRQFFYAISVPPPAGVPAEFRQEGPATVAGSTLTFGSALSPLTLKAGVGTVFAFFAVSQGAPGPIALQTVIKVPNVGPGPGFDFDNGLLDPATDTYYLADRTNKSVTIVNAKTNAIIGQVGGFIGQLASNAVSGPNGLGIVPGNRMYATDGNSTIKVIDLNTHTIIKTFATGGTKRTDAVVFDPDDNIVLVTNKNEAIPFVSFIDPTTDTIVAKTQIPSTQLDAALYDPTLKKFLITVTSTTANPGGEIDVVDPKTHLITGVYPLTGCLPGGLALGPSEHLLVGCSGDAIAAGFPAQSIILNAANGAVLKVIHEVGGSDQVTFNPGDNRFYLAARDMTSTGLPDGAKTPVLGVIDAVSLTFVQNVPTSPNAKSVAADPNNNKIFVPLTDVPGPGIGVYGPSGTP
ncbi:MAG: YncE family protein [Candidatus Velthaea sp.]